MSHRAKEATTTTTIRTAHTGNCDPVRSSRIQRPQRSPEQGHPGLLHMGVYIILCVRILAMSQ